MTLLCDFKELRGPAPTRKRCRRCGLTLRTSSPVEKCYSECRIDENGKPVAIKPCGGCQRDKDHPSKVEMLASFAKAMKEFKDSGFQRRRPDEYADAMQICRDCDRYSKPFGLPALERCQECGCFLRIKARMATEECPLGKWLRGS